MIDVPEAAFPCISFPSEKNAILKDCNFSSEISAHKVSIYNIAIFFASSTRSPFCVSSSGDTIGSALNFASPCLFDQDASMCRETFHSSPLLIHTVLISLLHPATSRDTRVVLLRNIRKTGHLLPCLVLRPALYVCNHSFLLGTFCLLTLGQNIVHVTHLPAACCTNSVYAWVSYNVLGRISKDETELGINLPKCSSLVPRVAVLQEHTSQVNHVLTVTAVPASTPINSTH